MNSETFQGIGPSLKDFLDAKVHLSDNFLRAIAIESIAVLEEVLEVGRPMLTPGSFALHRPLNDGIRLEDVVEACNDMSFLREFKLVYNPWLPIELDDSWSVYYNLGVVLCDMAGIKTEPRATWRDSLRDTIRQEYSSPETRFFHNKLKRYFLTLRVAEDKSLDGDGIKEDTIDDLMRIFTM